MALHYKRAYQPVHLCDECYNAGFFIEPGVSRTGPNIKQGPWVWSHSRILFPEYGMDRCPGCADGRSGGDTHGFWAPVRGQ